MLEEVKFRLRSRLWGRIKVRPGLPEPRISPAECAFYRMLVQRMLTQGERARVETVIDVGCRNWSYAQALAEAFPRAKLMGVELDGGRRYVNLHRRQDQAAAHALRLREQGREVSTFFRDFRECRFENESGRIAPQSLFTFFYPFVSRDPCEAWGLPARFAHFESSLRHALALDGHAWILSAHQGEWEAEIARNAYGQIGLKAREAVVAPSEFSGLWPSAYPVHLFRAPATAAREP